MPIRVVDGLPAKRILHEERIFALEEEIARDQRIRPLKVAILNLMPTKIETETQILRLISKSPLQVECDFMRMSSHESKNVSADHLIKFYDTFDAFADKNYDGLIITGAPVEQLVFEDVDYWDELCRVIDWSQEHVFSTMSLCWGALATLYHLYGIRKRNLPSKLFGVFPQRLCDEYSFLTNGFDEMHNMPHSRHAAVDTTDLAQHLDLQVLSESFATGPALIATRDFHEVYVLGHFEYGRDTLANEYWRDFHAGKPIKMPENYFPDNDPERQPIFTWRSHANLLYRNWLNWVYQMTPYELERIPAEVARLRDEVKANISFDKF
ncbi:MAG: homoserine O-succinyltransferase [Coriobacteriales bacterium]|nr:homoserine O-succinyltransferase [Coriobacteriales bacterium]